MFKPELKTRSTHAPSAKGGSVPSRSYYDRSHGDMVKREVNLRSRRIRAEQEELEEMTFQPEISRLAQSHGKSYLQLHHEPGAFLTKVELERRNREERRMQIQMETQMKEGVECTFVPKTKDCPAYVKRIAKSLAVVKAMQPSSTNAEVAEKPEWK